MSGSILRRCHQISEEHGPNKLKILPYVLIRVIVCCFCFCLKEIKKNGLRTPPLYQENPANKTQVRRNGSKVEISAGDLTLGDIVEVKAGDMIPADIRIIKSDGFKVKANTSNRNQHYDQTKTTYRQLCIIVYHRWTSRV